MSGLAERVGTMPAQVLAVYNVRIGAVLAGTLAPAATTILVDDVDVFVDERGYVALESADDLFVPADAVAGTDAYYDRPGSLGVEYDAVDRTARSLHLVVPWDATFPTFAEGTPSGSTRRSSNSAPTSRSTATSNRRSRRASRSLSPRRSPRASAIPGPGSGSRSASTTTGSSSSTSWANGR